MLPLSVLDIFPVPSGGSPSAAIHHAVELAQHVDALGFTRYWVAEHHNSPGIASSAPEVLIGHIAGKTKRIRVGAGGIMLPNHAPLRVVEIFRTLEALYPGRIDLGIGRAPGTDPVTSVALRRSTPDAESVNEQLAELFAFARHEFPRGHPFASIEAMPTDAPVPPLWMLGSTRAGAAIAASMGLGFAFAGHFSMQEAPGAVALYRSEFRPSAEVPKPRLVMAVSVIVGEDDAHAEELALPHKVGIARFVTGHRAPWPTLEEARRHRFTPQERAGMAHFEAGSLVGGPTRIREGLERLAEEMRADELMISTLIPDPNERAASYTRLAKLWGLG